MSEPKLREYARLIRQRDEARAERDRLREELDEWQTVANNGVGAQADLALQLQEARESAAQLAEALREAIDCMKDMRPYVSDYFAEKWNHDADIEKAVAALAAFDAKEKASPADGTRTSSTP